MIRNDDLETLDPADWDEFRQLAHEMLDEALDMQHDIRDAPAWRPIPESTGARFREGRPLDGIGTQAAFADLRELVLPHPTGTLHSRFWGWAGGQGSPTGMVADMMAAAMNSAAGNFDDAASRVEAQVTQWMKEAMGFPEAASGFITSGGSVANLIALAAARDAHAPEDSGRRGLSGGPPMVFYASSETHSSMHKAAKMLGLGLDAVRTVPVNDAFRMRVDLLAPMIEQDRARGLHPFAVVATVGTINTGSVDDLEVAGEVARDAGLWFHVDGAFGAIAALSPHTAHLVAGMSEADSLAFDFHKWMFVNYEAGCVLIRRHEDHTRPFTTSASYLAPLPRGTAAQPDPGNLRGPQLSKGFKALKVWLALKDHGFDRHGRIVWQNVQQARRLAEMIDASDTLERVAPVALNVVAFRHRVSGLSDADADEFNRELLMRIQERGIAIPSHTIVHDRFTLRACIINHRTRMEDLDILVDALESIGREVLSEMGGVGAERG